MSYSYSNLQLRTRDADAVRLAIDVCDIGSAKLLARQEVDWIGVYPFLTEDDYAYLKIVAAKMAARLNVPALAILVDETSLDCAMFDGNEAMAEFHRSANKNAEQVSDAAIDALLSLCKSGTKKSAVTKLFAERPASAADENKTPEVERTVQGLAQLLAIPRVQLCTGFNHLKWAQAGR